MAKDYYAVLGVGRSASGDEIKKAYRLLAKKHHPDLNRSHESSDRFKEINEAYAVLGDEKKREAYDRFGTTSEGFSAGQGGFGFSDGGFAEGFDVNDIFEQFFGGGFRRDTRTRGSDIRVDADLTLEEAARGASRKISISRSEQCRKCSGTGAESKSDMKKCPECNGTGQVRRSQRIAFGTFTTAAACGKCRGKGTIIANHCRECRGRGFVNAERQVEIKIPAGVEDGMKLRISGEGNSADVPGSLFVFIHVLPHKVFDRHGNDLRLEVPITFAQAAMGAEIEIPTLEGNATLSIPPGTQPGTVFRMRGKGLPDIETGHYGDQKIKVIVKVPERLTKRQRELLQQFEKEDGKGFFGKVF